MRSAQFFSFRSAAATPPGTARTRFGRRPCEGSVRRHAQGRLQRTTPRGARLLSAGRTASAPFTDSHMRKRARTAGRRPASAGMRRRSIVRKTTRARSATRARASGFRRSRRSASTSAGTVARRISTRLEFRRAPRPPQYRRASRQKPRRRRVASLPAVPLFRRAKSRLSVVATSGETERQHRASIGG
jgi:hypothetical protein